MSEYASGSRHLCESSSHSLDAARDRAEQYLAVQGSKGWIERIEINRHGGLIFLLASGNDCNWIDFAAKSAHLSGPLDDPDIPLSAVLAGAGADSRYEVLNYRPSRRLVVAGRHDHTDVVLKGYCTGKCASHARKARLAAQILEGSDIRTAVVLDVNLRSDYMLMPHLDGHRPEILAQQAGDFLLLGKGIRCLQAAPGAPEQDLLALEEFGRLKELAVLDERLRRLKLVGGSLPPRWQELRVRLEETAAKVSPAEPVTAHRDLHDGQWLIDRDRPCLLDFDLLCRAEPELDPGNFLAHLSLRHLQHSDQLSAQDADTCGQTFLEGLDLPETRDSQCRLHFYQASTFARLALVYLLRPRWQQLVPELVHHGHQCLNNLQQVGA